jgi:hypothetical protein
MKNQSVKILITQILARLSTVNVLTQEEKNIVLAKISDGMTVKEAQALLKLLDDAVTIEMSKGTK